MHIGFIMDGNRRWATSHKMIKLLGHSKGSDNVENVLKMCIEKGIEYASMWVIAKKNLEERSKEEIEHLFGIIRKRIPEMLPRFIENGVRFETIGNKALLPHDINEILEKVTEETKDQNKITFILAIGYGGQDEIVRGVKEYIKDNLEALKSGNLDILDGLDENVFSNYMDTGRFPAPDLIIRTGGDIRSSGYFLYQSEYSEFHFTPTLWPDFAQEDLDEALVQFNKTKRNFGK